MASSPSQALSRTSADPRFVSHRLSAPHNFPFYFHVFVCLSVCLLACLLVCLRQVVTEQPKPVPHMPAFQMLRLQSVHHAGFPSLSLSSWHFPLFHSLTFQPFLLQPLLTHECDGKYFFNFFSLICSIYQFAYCKYSLWADSSPVILVSETPR